MCDLNLPPFPPHSAAAVSRKFEFAVTLSNRFNFRTATKKMRIRRVKPGIQ